MLLETIKRRTKQCEGCHNDFVVSQKQGFAKAKFCSQKCFLNTITTEQRVTMAKKAATHGMYNTRIYRIWGAMKQRCLNPNQPAYKSYGGSGICVDDRWLSFEGFYKDMQHGYEDGLTLDRTDGTKSYYKENCRWATRKQQSSNIRNNVFVDCDGEVLCMSACARKLGVDPSTVSGRIYSGKLKRVWKKVA